MSISALNVAIENKFATSWSDTTVRYENIPFTIPSTSWVSLAVKTGKRNKITLGTGTQLRRTLGTTFVNIYTPLNNGVKPAAVLADSVKDIFKDLVVSGITFYEPSVTILGELYFSNSGSNVTSTAQWYQVVVDIPFKYDEYV